MFRFPRFLFPVRPERPGPNQPTQPGRAGYIKAQIPLLIAAIDDEAARLKTKRRVSCATVRDRFVCVARNEAQRLRLPSGSIIDLEMELDLMIRLALGIEYSPEAIDYMADQAREIIRKIR